MKPIEYIDRATGRIEQEVVPGERWLRWLYHTATGKAALSSVVKRRFLSRWYGRKMDASASCRKIPEFVRDLSIDMNEASAPIESFASFNDFFIRTLKPTARPVDPSPQAVVSPADGKALAFENLSGFETFFVKGQRFLLNSFLQDEALAQRYADGTLMIVRLAPADYHRFHFPADGVISASKPIKGAYKSVSPIAVRHALGVYWQNKREYSVLKTEAAGDILICEVGATMVGTIVQTYEDETSVHKGQEKGYFKFGGSTVILLFEKGQVKVDADILENTRNGYETSVKMGTRIAQCLD
jgi:phosphatidylserine decarboxylase